MEDDDVTLEFRPSFDMEGRNRFEYARRGRQSQDVARPSRVSFDVAHRMSLDPSLIQRGESFFFFFFFVFFFFSITRSRTPDRLGLSAQQESAARVRHHAARQH